MTESNLRRLSSVLLASLLAAQITHVATGGAHGDSNLPAATFFSKNVKVNSGGTPYDWQVEPTMVVGDNGVVFAGWKEAFTDSGGGQRVAFSRSMDGGSSWSSNVLMATANPGAQASDPWLIKDGAGRTHFVRLEYNQAGSISGITVSNTTDGLVWGTTNYMNDLPNFADKETAWADASGNLYMAYNSNTMVNDLRFRKSTDGGVTWTPRVRVPDGAGNIIGAYIVRDHAGRLFVAWSNYATGNIMIDSSIDDGINWGTDIQVNDVPGTILDTLPTNWNMSMPAIAVDTSDNLYVIWTDYRIPNSFGDIYLSRSTNHGATWSPAVKVNDDAGPAGQRMADICIDSSGILHAAWYDHRNGGYDVYYSNSSNGGQTWSANLRVSTVTTPRFYERPGDYITIRPNPVDGNVYVVWTDGRGADFDIYFAALVDAVGTQTIATNPPGLQITIDGAPHVAPQVRNWADGEIHVIGTIENQTISYGTRYAFVDWSDSGPLEHPIMVAGSMDFTAEFRLQHYLAVSSAHGNPTGSGWYDLGTTTLGCLDANLVQQSVDTRHRLAGWSEDATGTGLCTDPLTMNGPRNATAVWMTQFLVTATTPHGTITGDGWHDDGNTTSLTLSIGFVQIGAGERAQFTAWAGQASGTGLTSDVMFVDSPKTATAQWQTEYLLTVVSQHGTPIGGGWFVSGTSATISIDPVVQGTTGTRFVFTGWTGSIVVNDPATTVAMDAPKTVTAQWRTEHFIDVVSDHGVVNGTGWYKEGTIANISAPMDVTDENGTWRFTNWSGGYSSRESSAGVLVDGPKVIMANWEASTIEPPSGVDANLLFFIIVAVVVVLLIVLFILWWRRKKGDEDAQPQTNAEK